MKFVIVETDNGEQFFEDTVSAGFRIAKTKEDERRNSVEYVAIASNVNSMDSDVIIYTGQALRMMLRLLDNEAQWIRAGSSKWQGED